jgi:hypothetical protein
MNSTVLKVLFYRLNTFSASLAKQDLTRYMAAHFVNSKKNPARDPNPKSEKNCCISNFYIHTYPI